MWLIAAIVAAEIDCCTNLMGVLLLALRLSEEICQVCDFNWVSNEHGTIVIKNRVVKQKQKQRYLERSLLEGGNGCMLLVCLINGSTI